MNFRLLPANEHIVLRFVRELWRPYHRELEEIVDRHALADEVDLVAEEVQYRLERVKTDTHQNLVAIESPHDEDPGGDQVFTDSDTDLVGFITTDYEEAPAVFDQPAQLVIGDVYVRPSHRGAGLGRALIDRAKARAIEEGCGELALDVDLDNERAVSFYREIGFEPYRYRMTRRLDGR